MILLEYQNRKILLQKTTLQIGLKKFLWLKQFKTLWRGHLLLMILTEIVGTLCKLETTPVDLSKLNDVVKNEIVK